MNPDTWSIHELLRLLDICEQCACPEHEQLKGDIFRELKRRFSPLRARTRNVRKALGGPEAGK